MDADKQFNKTQIEFRLALPSDLASLLTVEVTCFETDRLSRRRMGYWIKAEHGLLLVALIDNQVLGYGLVILRQGSRSARLYSFAVMPQARGLNMASGLLAKLERLALERQRLFMRLEVAQNNHPAIAMYKKLGYRKFGIYRHYYENGEDALRFQKPILQSIVASRLTYYPWYKQTTEFTCGPSALMMAMKYLNSNTRFDQETEIEIWRQATTIFMTSGHGGCHPLGLAIAARERMFAVEVYTSQLQGLFVDGVRSEHKKSIMRIVERNFIQKASALNIMVNEREVQLSEMENAIAGGHAVICLISTYQFDGKKAPHWVAITHTDERCLYLHDPDGSDTLHEGNRGANDVGEYEDIDLDYQHLPILKEDFSSLSVFGKRKLRTCLFIKALNT